MPPVSPGETVTAVEEVVAERAELVADMATIRRKVEALRALYRGEAAAPVVVVDAVLAEVEALAGRLAA